MSQVNRILDLKIKQEKRSKLIKIFSYTFIIIFLGGIFSYAQFKNFERVKFSTEFDGVIVSIHSDAAMVAGEKQFVVDLSSGKQLNFNTVPTQIFAADDKVIVVKQELESGQIKYQLKPVN